MKAMVLTRVQPVGENSAPLETVERPIPEPGDVEILIRVTACGVCHTELDEIEGRTPPPRLPVIPGHQVIGRVERRGRSARAFKPGERVGVGWIHSACGACAYCRSGRENLCPDFKATGRDADGGYAEYMIVPEAFAHPLPAIVVGHRDGPAPLRRRGRISVPAAGRASGGWASRSDRVRRFGPHRPEDGPRRVPVEPGLRLRPQRRRAGLRPHAGRGLGRGHRRDRRPKSWTPIIDTTPVWTPVVGALKNLAPGGRLVINAIRKEETDKSVLLSLDYARDLWMEKEIKSVANVTRADIRDFLALAERIGLKPDVETFPLEDANRALVDLKMRRIRGAKVLKI